jgi:hypothetical protein
MSYETIVEEQFYLARHGGISLYESSVMPEFEREAFINLLVKDLKKEKESYNIKP